MDVAFDLGIMSDAALDISTVALDWFNNAWLSIRFGDRGWVSTAQARLDNVVGHRLPQFEDRQNLTCIYTQVNQDGVHSEWTMHLSPDQKT